MKDIFIGLIEKTNDPTAPVIINKVFENCERLAKMLVPFGNNAEVQKMTDKLLQAFSKTDDSFAHDPNFIIALCALLVQSIIEYARSVANDRA